MKPEPPEDLWEQLDKVAEECQVGFNPPPDSFTRLEFQERYKISSNQANKRLRKFVKAGKVEITRRGTGTYYLLVKK